MPQWHLVQVDACAQGQHFAFVLLLLLLLLLLFVFYVHPRTMLPEVGQVQVVTAWALVQADDHAIPIPCTLPAPATTPYHVPQDPYEALYSALEEMMYAAQEAQEVPPSGAPLSRHQRQLARDAGRELVGVEVPSLLPKEGREDLLHRLVLEPRQARAAAAGDRATAAAAAAACSKLRGSGKAGGSSRAAPRPKGGSSREFQGNGV